MTVRQAALEHAALGLVEFRGPAAAADRRLLPFPTTLKEGEHRRPVVGAIVIGREILAQEDHITPRIAGYGIRPLGCVVPYPKGYQ